MRTHCLRCGDKFSPANVYSHAGWRETMISGFCEECFNEVTLALENAHDQQDREISAELRADEAREEPRRD